MVRLLLILCHFSMATLVLADEIKPIPKDLVQCSVCHGAQLMGNQNTKAPRLTALPAWYIENQLAAFNKGWRGQHAEDTSGAEMMPVAKMLSTDTIKQAIAFIESSSSPTPKATFSANKTKGKQLYNQCIACHGDLGQGNQAVAAPPLVGLNDWYIVTQLKHFKQGVRGSNQQDSNGQTMMAAAQALNDDNAMLDLAHYITSLASDKDNQ